MTTGPVEMLGDHAARAEIAGRLDATLFVEAGAGTGKTTALVSRVVALVRSGEVQPSELAAITFTEEAAAQLRDRIRSAFVAGSDEPLLIEALSQLDEAAITTIHGFALRILTEHPLESGLPLRFRVLDAIESSLRFEHQMALFLEEFYEGDRDAELAAATVAIGVTPVHLRGLADMFDEIDFDQDAVLGVVASSVSAASLAALRSMNEEGAASLLQAIARAVSFRENCSDQTDRLSSRLDVLQTAAAEYELGVDWLDRLTWLLSLSQQKVSNVGRRDHWVGCDIGEVREVVGAFEEERLATVDGVVHLVLDLLAQRLAELARSFASDRRAAGELSFHDLLVATRDLLRKDERVRRSVRSRYRLILIDEFQDTDPIQLEIVTLLGLAEGGDAVEPGRLFFVGDPRQSIYRFRGAKPELYEQARDDLIGGIPVRLTTNFRSVPGVLAFVNAVFADLFRRDDDDPDREVRDLSPTLHPARPALDEARPVVILGGAALSDETVGARRARESAEIARFIAEAIDEGLVVDDNGADRPARFGDVAVLIPRRTGLSELEHALDEHGVPYRLESTALVYQSAEVRDLLSCLRAIDLPGDEPAILAALRTPYFACGDDDLLAYRSLGGEWRYDRRPRAEYADQPVAEALLALGSLHARRHALGVYGTLRAIIDERRVVEVAIGRRHAREAMRRIDFVCREARSFCDSGGASLREFLLFTELQSNLGARSIDVAGTSGEDAVRILTIHGAKGLEFPVVILTELGGSPRGAPQLTRVLRSPDGRLEMRAASGRKTNGFDAISDREELLEHEERLRLCYVAATRARDHLVVSLHHQPAKSASARSLAELLEEACNAAPDTWRRAESVGEPPVSRTAHRAITTARTLKEPIDQATYEQLRDAQHALIARLARPVSVASSGLAGLANGSWPLESSRSALRRSVSGPRSEELPDELARIEAKDGASALGRAVHRVLEEVDFEALRDITALIEQAVVDEDIVERSGEVATLVAAALRARCVVEAVQSGRYWRELPVTAIVEDRVLEAVIDLCYEHNGALVVVDYKTDAVADAEEATAAVEHYRLQGGAYALALSSVTDYPVQRVVFLFLTRAGEPIEVELPDLEEAMSAAREVLIDNVVAVRDESIEERAGA